MNITQRRNKKNFGIKVVSEFFFIFMLNFRVHVIFCLFVSGIKGIWFCSVSLRRRISVMWSEHENHSLSVLYVYMCIYIYSLLEFKGPTIRGKKRNRKWTRKRRREWTRGNIAWNERFSCVIMQRCWCCGKRIVPEEKYNDRICSHVSPKEREWEIWQGPTLNLRFQHFTHR